MTARLIRDVVTRPARAYCHHPGCGFDVVDLNIIKVSSQAEAHVATAGHVVSLVRKSEVVIQRSHLAPVPDPDPAMPALTMPAARPWPDA